jgi:hypothetical protein
LDGEVADPPEQACGGPGVTNFRALGTRDVQADPFWPIECGLEGLWPVRVEEGGEFMNRPRTRPVGSQSSPGLSDAAAVEDEDRLVCGQDIAEFGSQGLGGPDPAGVTGQGPAAEGMRGEVYCITPTHK